MPDLVTRYVDGLLDLLAGGGAAMPALFVVAWAMWATILWRATAVLPGGGAPVDALWDDAQAGKPVRGRGALREAVRRVHPALPSLTPLPDEQRAEWVRLQVASLRRTLSQQRLLAGSLITSAPLLGLLGTVSGMIETFDALGQQAMFRQSGGIAGGISEALLTTQVGLFIAIPGTLAARMIDRREDALQRGLTLLEALVQRDGGAA